jgi:hypothetical protein
MSRIQEAKVFASRVLGARSVKTEAGKLATCILDITEYTIPPSMAKVIVSKNLKHSDECVPPRDCVCGYFKIQNTLNKIGAMS